MTTYPTALPCLECGKLCIPHDQHRCKKRKVKWERVSHLRAHHPVVLDEDGGGYAANARRHLEDVA